MLHFKSEQYCQKDFQSRVIYNQVYACYELDTLLADLDASLNGSGVEILKEGDTSTVWAVPFGARKLVVKRYNIKGVWHGVRRALRRSNAEASWNNAHLLLSLNILTPAPVALVEKRIGPIRRQAYFISEFVDAMYCYYFFVDPFLHNYSLPIVADKIVEVFSQLKKNNIAHGDLKGTNILITDGEPLLIDLDYMTQYKLKPLFYYRYSRDRQRFMRVWKDKPEIAKLFRALLID